MKDFPRNFFQHNSVMRLLAFLATLVATLIVLERYQIRSAFSLLPGDRYDAVISATILEHWLNVFQGKSEWLEVNYFYPYTRTIAHTDAYFLVGLAYIPFRLIGFDPFVAHEFAGILLKSIGFLGAYVLSKRFLNFSFGYSLLAATLFTLSNGMTTHSSRLQLATVAFSPIMAILLWRTCGSFLEKKFASFRVWGASTSLFFGAWCLTCFYIAWFFGFFILAFAGILLICSDKRKLLEIARDLRAQYFSVALVIFSLLISIAPFVYAYLPKSREVGVRSYESALGNTVPIENILQTGNSNFLFGRIYNDFLSFVRPSYTINGEYAYTGFSVALVYFFAAGAFLLIRKRPNNVATEVLRLATFATLFTWLTTLNFFGSSMWYFVYHIIPGAKALNVVSIYQIFLALPITLIAVKFLTERRTPSVVQGFIIFVLIAGEINQPYLALDRKTELARLANIQPPPSQCRSFYVSGWEEQINSPPGSVDAVYAHNVSAMLIAQSIHLPTINGVASFFPPDWNLANPKAIDYEKRVMAYADSHGIEGLCKLDLNSSEWTPRSKR